jgi:rhodanese-related sulfurtransferase
MSKRVSSKEANDLLAAGWKYVDVRSIPEFEQGHPPGAFNVPLLHLSPSGQMMPNPEFVPVFQKHFQKGDKLVLGCKAGSRSLKAAQLLASLGYTELVDTTGGFDEWKASLPVETTTPEGHGWEALKK